MPYMERKPRKKLRHGPSWRCEHEVKRSDCAPHWKDFSVENKPIYILVDQAESGVSVRLFRHSIFRDVMNVHGELKMLLCHQNSCLSLKQELCVLDSLYCQHTASL